MANDDYSTDKILAAIAPPIGSCPISYTFASTGNSSTSLSIARPESPVGATIEGNILIASLDFTIPNYLPLGTPTGWVQIGTTLIDNPGNNKDLSKLTFYKVATANEPLTYTWTFGNPTKTSGGIVCVETGATSYSVFSKNDYPTSATNILSSGVTTTSNDTLVFAFFTSAHGADTFTPPATWTSLYTAATGGASGSTSLGVGKDFPIAGPTGSFTALSTQSVPRSVHVVGVVCAPKERGAGTLTATATSSLSAKVNNIFKEKTITATASSPLSAVVKNQFKEKTIVANSSANLSSIVNNSLYPGSVFLGDSTATLSAAVNYSSASVFLALSDSNTSALVNNIFNENTITSSGLASITTEVNNIFAYNNINANAYAETSAEVNNVFSPVTATAEASVSLSAKINNIFAPVTSVATSSALINLVSVNNIFSPGALAYCDATGSMTGLINGQGEPVAFASASADSGALVNNLLQANILVTSTSSCNPQVRSNAELTTEAIAMTSCGAVIDNEVKTNDSLVAIALASLQPEIFREVSIEGAIATAVATISKATEPIRPIRSVDVSINPVLVEGDPVIRLI